MITDSYSVFAVSPSLGQWRAQISYALSDCNEVGVWASWRGSGNTREVTLNETTTDLTFRPIGQANLFWHHNFDSGADSWLWFGVPENASLGSDGSLGNFIVGASLRVPLTDRVAVSTMAQYMHPTATPGFAAATERAYTISVGLTFYPWAAPRPARSPAIAGCPTCRWPTTATSWFTPTRAFNPPEPQMRLDC